MGADSALQRVRCKPCGATFSCPAGALCLDFCNTCQGAKAGAEWVTSYADLLDWLEAAGALGAEQARRLRLSAREDPDAAARALREVLELRVVLLRAVEARTRGKAPAREDLAQLAAAYRRSATHARLDWRDGRAMWALDPGAGAPDAVLQPILQSATELLTSDTLDRVRLCGNPACQWLFVDHTRNRSRRWCDMASCGNLHKVRRHRERQSACAPRRRAKKCDGAA